MTHTYLKIRFRRFVGSLLLIASLLAASSPFAAAQEPQGKSSTSPLAPPSVPDVIRQKLEACNPQAMREVDRLEKQAAQLNKDSMYASANAQIAEYEAQSADYAAREAQRFADDYQNSSAPFWRKEAQKFPAGSADRAYCEERIDNALQRARENAERAERLKQEAGEKAREARARRAEAERLQKQAEQLSNRARQIISKVFESCEKPAGTSAPKPLVNQVQGSQPFTQPTQSSPPNDQFDQGAKEAQDPQSPSGEKGIEGGKPDTGDNKEIQPVEPEKKKKTSWKKSLLKNGLLIGGGVATGILIGKTGGHHRSDSVEHAREIQVQQTDCKKPKH